MIRWLLAALERAFFSACMILGRPMAPPVPSVNLVSMGGPFDNDDNDSVLPSSERLGGRPQGEVREALMASAKRLFQLRLQSPLVTPDGEPLVGAMGWEIARHAQVGRQAAAATIKNMVRAGDLRVIGRFHPPEMPRPLKVYAPREPAPRNWGNPLNDVMAGWGRPKPDADSGR